MQRLETYVSRLEHMAVNLHRSENLGMPFRASVEAALNGELSKTLRTVVPLTMLRESGAFFTDEIMANQLAQTIPAAEMEHAKVLDAACGGGNLLLAHARRMPMRDNLTDTLRYWGRKLHGMDVHLAFVRATRARLVLLAAQRGIERFGVSFVRAHLPTMEELFPHIVQANSLDVCWPATDYMLLNPPFNRVSVPVGCRWTTGQISAAALFIVHGLQGAAPQTQVRAILPDVLRAGSRYSNWRKKVESLSFVQGVEMLGAFDSQTAVDVFILTLMARKSVVEALNDLTSDWWHAGIGIQQRQARPAQTVADFFHINVGRVVPYRDLEAPELTSYPYFDVQHTPAWETVDVQCTEAHRRFAGRTFNPPFVLIRRNSRAKDRFRAVGTIVTDAPESQTLVAVENHLVVARPISGQVEDCQALLNVLKSAQTNQWINDRIRCRHLTVGAVKDIPWWNS